MAQARKHDSYVLDCRLDGKSSEGDTGDGETNSEEDREGGREKETEKRESERRERGRWGIRAHDGRKSAAKVATDSIPGFPIPESPRVLQARLY